MAEVPESLTERLPWVQPDWLAEARAWIDEHVAVTGEVEQPHVRWWSTVLRVPTRDGDLWFKAAAPVHAFEAGLLSLLERVRPGSVPALIAADAARGWVLMRDGGTRLRELVSESTALRRWEEALPLYADLQIALAPHVDELLALGVPDARLERLPAQLERVLEDDEALLLGQPEGLTAEERDRLRSLLPDFRRLCGELGAHGIPETLQHDDLHDGNVFVDDGRVLFFDWGDSCVSHPFHTLVVTLRVLAYKLELEPGSAELARVRDAYLEPFTRYAPRDELVAAARLALQTGTVGRALAWHRFVSPREPEFRPEDAEAVPWGLKQFLDGAG